MQVLVVAHVVAQHVKVQQLGVREVVLGLRPAIRAVDPEGDRHRGAALRRIVQ
jgi:hypothetical protein